ncbi:ZIP family metal transporter [Paenibacillus sp. IITD108]|uniref:ZIP family metal transporter n=1 Tax=Paenibacillus sp. IITD108 TaxID=3116649 RepID=UPI002F3F232B
MEGYLSGLLISSLATGIGAIPILFFRRISHFWMDILLAFTGGVMVAASTHGLIPASLKLTNLFNFSCGVIIGAIALGIVEKLIPHVDLKHSQSDIIIPAQSIMLITAMAIHNIPEGLSVGAGFASEADKLGFLIALSIGLQNIPEGFLIALFLVHQKVNRFTAIAVAFLTGAIEIAAGVLGYHLSGLSLNLVPFGLAFAAGAILFIVYKELIPETHGHGYERAATFSFIVGIVCMIGLVEWFR